MNKKRIMALALSATLVAGVAFNAATTANYTENLGEVTQTINAATWEVEMGTTGKWDHTIFPGDIIGDDVITLNNNNDYPVKYTVQLSTEGNGLDEALTLNLKQGEVDKRIKETDNNVIEINVEGNELVQLNSHVTWDKVNEETDRGYEGKSVEYKYDVTAEAITEN